MQPAAKTKEENIVRPSGFTQATTTMDVPRAGVAKKKRQKRIILVSLVVLGLIAATFGLSRLKPAVPSVDRSTVWIDTVKRGPMVRQVRGLGVLVPEEIRWIAAITEGRVDKIIVRPGAQVEPDTVLLELSSPEVEQVARDADLQYKAAEAELTTLRASLQRELLEQESSAARVHSEYQQAKMENETNDSLAKNGLVSALTHKTSKIKAEDLAARDAIEQKRFEFAQNSIEPQLAAKQAAV
ncbi:MAG: RND transporter, partial [Chthoniobacterales bacterium]